MSLQTNLKGRLRNTSLSRTHGLLPIFEAVINSIQSLEKQYPRDLSTKGNINIQIVRKPTQKLKGFNTEEDIQDIIVTDNGVGFTNENIKSFETLDSDYKLDQGCKGIGRLLWLKAFKQVEITSTFEPSPKSTNYQTIKIIFNDRDGVQTSNENLSEAKRKTIVKLFGFDLKYQHQKKIETIAKISSGALFVVFPSPRRSSEHHDKRCR